MSKRPSERSPDKTVRMKRIRELEDQLQAEQMETDSDDSAIWPIDVLEDSEPEDSVVVEHEDEEQVQTSAIEEKIKIEEEDPIPEEILKLLGNAPASNTYGPKIHQELGYRVNEVIRQGLQKEEREDLLGTYPTASQFIGGLKTTLLSNLATAGVRGTNCENDNNEAILGNLKALLSPEHEVPDTIVPGTSCSSENLTDVYVPDNFVADDISGEMQACAYVCGFLKLAGCGVDH